MTSHVLTHLLHSLSLSVSDMLGTSKQIVPGGLERRMLVVGSIILGVVVAIVFLLWDSTWAHWLNTYRQGG